MRLETWSRDFHGSRKEVQNLGEQYFLIKEHYRLSPSWPPFALLCNVLLFILIDLLTEVCKTGKFSLLRYEQCVGSVLGRNA